MCTFCDDVGSLSLRTHHDVVSCYSCRYRFRIDFDEQVTGECGVCFEETTLLTLPCDHTLCTRCVKIIYYGIPTTPTPVHWRELPFPSWKDMDNEKYSEYKAFRLKWLHTNPHETLLQRRDALCSTRPSWMNTEAFLEYENNLLQVICSQKKWDEYEDQKFKGNGSCPYCKRKKRTHKCILLS
uniref:RING-type domain-containing protein n=1 Tax=viral metagenome TaxID=1070528 RepID=A0A6C0HZG2_9ZZZZ